MAESASVFSRSYRFKVLAIIDKIDHEKKPMIAPATNIICIFKLNSKNSKVGTAKIIAEPVDMPDRMQASSMFSGLQNAKRAKPPSRPPIPDIILCIRKALAPVTDMWFSPKIFCLFIHRSML